MNPAALKTNLKDLQKGGILVVNDDAFSSGDLHKAGYKTNPLEDGSLKGYKIYRIPINKLNREAVAEMKLSPREADRCKNFFALGLVYWLYERPLEPDPALDPREIRQEPSGAGGQHADAEGRLQLRRNHRDHAGALPRRQGADQAWPLSQDHRQ